MNRILGGFVLVCLAVAAIVCATLYVAVWQWFFFVYLASFDVYKVLTVLEIIFAAWLVLWSFVSIRKVRRS